MGFLISLVLLGLQAHAGLARSNISNVGISLYGVFMTSDPSCQAGLIASMPLSKTPTHSNFVTAPVLGAGPTPNKIACVVLIVDNQVQVGWNAGPYAAPDNVCSAGGSLNVNPCVSTTLNWPATITETAAGVGLALSQSCPAVPTGNEVVAVYMSINSACTGSSVVDQSTSGCSTLGKTTSALSQAPTTNASNTSGARIQILPINGRVVFAVDPDQIISGQSGSCAAAGAPVFSIHQ